MSRSSKNLSLKLWIWAPSFCGHAILTSLRYFIYIIVKFGYKLNVLYKKPKLRIENSNFKKRSRREIPRRRSSSVSIRGKMYIHNMCLVHEYYKAFCLNRTESELIERKSHRNICLKCYVFIICSDETADWPLSLDVIPSCLSNIRPKLIIWERAVDRKHHHLEVCIWCDSKIVKDLFLEQQNSLEHNHMALKLQCDRGYYIAVDFWYLTNFEIE